MALIAEYQRDPQLTALSQPDDYRATAAASYTELPASVKPAPGASPAMAGRAPVRAGPAGNGGSGRAWLGSVGPPPEWPWW